MQDLYEKDISINPFTGNPKRGLYVEPKLSITGMSAMPEFEERFIQHHFEWMTIAPRHYSLALV